MDNLAPWLIGFLLMGGFALTLNLYRKEHKL